MHFVRTTLLTTLNILLRYIGDGQSTETEICELESGNDGSCVYADECPAALQLIKKGGYPKLCGFDGKVPIVCCEEVGDVPLQRNQRESVAEEKCLEFNISSALITTTTESPITTFRITPPRRSIVSGSNAIPLEFPHMALLGYGTSDNIEWKCGGSLVSEKFVLTAAHCIDTRLGRVTFITLGLHQINFVTDYVQRFSVEDTFVHPDYSPSQNYHDIALIELDEEADISVGVTPACLYVAKELPEVRPIATGWGATEAGGQNSPILQKVELSFVPFDSCSPSYQPSRKLKDGLVDDGQLCAGNATTTGDTCQGDSGGPLQVKTDDKTLWTVVGVTSFGIQCGVVPGIYTRVSNYVPWIESVIWEN